MKITEGINIGARRENMRLVELIESDEEEQTSQELAAIEAYVPRPDEPRNVAPILVRKVQTLDVDAVLARSLPKLGLSPRDVKTIVLRKPSDV